MSSVQKGRSIFNPRPLAQNFQNFQFFAVVFLKETEDLDYMLSLSNFRLCDHSCFFDPVRVKIHKYLLAKYGPGVLDALT